MKWFPLSGHPLYCVNILQKPLQKYSADSNQIWCEASGQWGLVRLCSTSGSAPSRGNGGQFTPKSGLFFKNLVRNYQAECAEIDMRASEACLDVKLCSTWRLPPGNPLPGSGDVPIFWQWTQKRFLLPNYRSDSDQIKHGAGGRWVLLRLCSSFGSAPLRGLGGNLPPNPIFSSKIFIRNYQAECGEIDLGASGACLDVELGSRRVCLPK